jgi:hypothetical protein
MKLLQILTALALITMHSIALGQSQTAIPPGTELGCSAANSSACSPTALKRPNFYVTDYGAVCDGATNDATAISNAITAAGAVSGTVVIPGSTCRVTSTINVGSANVHIVGQGMFTSGISVASSTFNLFTITGSGYVVIENLTLASFGQSGSSTYYAISDTGSCIPYLTVQNVKIFGFDNGIASCGANATIDNLWYSAPTSSFTGTLSGTSLTVSGVTGTISTGSVLVGTGVPVGTTIVSGSGSSWVVSGAGATIGPIAMTATSGDGIKFSTTSEIKRVTRSIINGGLAGIEIVGGSAFDLIGNEIQGGGYALLIDPPNSVPVNSVVMVDEWHDSTKIDGILLNGTAGAVHRVSMNGSWASSSLGNGIEVEGVVLGLHIANSEIFNNSNNGITVDNAATITGLALTGNLIGGNAADGVYIGSNSTHFSITGNIIGPSADFGANGNGLIINADSQDYYIVVGNNMLGNTTTNFSDGGTGQNRQVLGNVVGCLAIAGSICNAGAGSNSASGTGAIVNGGFGNTAAGYHSVVSGGDSNYVGGAYSAAPGGQQSNDRSRYGVECFSSKANVTASDAQFCDTVLHGIGSSTTAIRVTSDGATAGSADCVNIPSNAMYVLTINVAILDFTNTTKNATYNEWTGVMSRTTGVGTTALTMNTTPTPIQNGTFAPTISATADTTNACLNLSITPPAANTDTIHVVAHVHTVEAF